MVNESSAAFNEGEEQGRREKRGAFHCPYMPGQAQAQRDDWMAGFSKSRANIAPISASDDAPRPTNTPHGG